MANIEKGILHTFFDNSLKNPKKTYTKQQFKYISIFNLMFHNASL